MLLVFLGLVGFFVGFGFAIVPPVSEQISAFIHNLTSGDGYLQQLQNNPRLKDGPPLPAHWTRPEARCRARTWARRPPTASSASARSCISGVFSTLTVLILTLYFLSSLPSITGFMYRLAPRSRRARVALLGDEILTRIGGYVAGNLLISLIAGLRRTLPADRRGAVRPRAGAARGDHRPDPAGRRDDRGDTRHRLAFFSGLWTGVAVAIFFAIYQQAENYIIQPRVMKRSVDVQPAVTIIAALIGGTLLGVIGALLAIPAAAAFALILREVVMPRQEQL